MKTVQEIYKALSEDHRGSLSILAKRTGTSGTWIRLVLSEKAKDEDLVLAAAQLWDELESAKDEKVQRATELAHKAAQKRNARNLAIATA